MTYPDEQPALTKTEREKSLAAFYGLYLRAKGFAADEAAAMVMERYPSARRVLEPIANGEFIKRANAKWDAEHR